MHTLPDQINCTVACCSFFTFQIVVAPLGGDSKNRNPAVVNTWSPCVDAGVAVVVVVVVDGDVWVSVVEVVVGGCVFVQVCSRS